MQSTSTPSNPRNIEHQESYYAGFDCARDHPNIVVVDGRGQIAWALADALRRDGHRCHALAATDPLVAELRILCRDEVALSKDRTALIN